MSTHKTKPRRRTDPKASYFGIRARTEQQAKEMGERIRRLRGTRSVIDVMRATGLSRSGYQKIENGERLPTAGNLLAIAEALEADPAEILQGSRSIIAGQDAAIVRALSCALRITPARLRSLVIAGETIGLTQDETDMLALWSALPPIERRAVRSLMRELHEQHQREPPVAPATTLREPEPPPEPVSGPTPAPDKDEP